MKAYTQEEQLWVSILNNYKGVPCHLRKAAHYLLRRTVFKICNPHRRFQLDSEDNLDLIWKQQNTGVIMTMINPAWLKYAVIKKMESWYRLEPLWMVTLTLRALFMNSDSWETTGLRSLNHMQDCTLVSFAIISYGPGEIGTMAILPFVMMALSAPRSNYPLTHPNNWAFCKILRYFFCLHHV